MTLETAKTRYVSQPGHDFVYLNFRETLAFFRQGVQAMTDQVDS